MTIVEATTWPREHFDLCGPAFLRFDADGSDEMAFGALTSLLNVGFTGNGVGFDWNRSGEGDLVGNRWADVRDDGSLEGEIAYQKWRRTTFSAEPWPFQQPASCG